MAVISVRLNSEEEKIVSFLSEHLEKDKSTLIRDSIMEMYEDYIDREFIERFESDEINKKFITAEDILKSI
ncbi:DUF6290 family protein [Gracilinema caldarium]|uniref:CopG family transcriptional regulator n=1 Tax=Gracilinema caldarium (strain ATCC 51460 / DSM 7334 / H1) TaxID=744872 RepID=F8EYL1_GRAC1|nr:DUF6290 family protein [Gracilinema caldarium]AEJ18588.1 hypothetical protein Spica_0424 [Gracilinema caldarium DSM 7334]